jgi:hypothetical protein
MADRGQITGGVLDGPLAFDSAISKEATSIKGIVSEVAGDPDILLAPDFEAGNILAKQLTFLANADSAGFVLGARADHPHETRRQRALAHRQRSRRDASRARAARGAMTDYALVLNAARRAEARGGRARRARRSTDQRSSP